jgi:hypothetical protein
MSQCDERHPTCGGCARLRRQCSYAPIDSPQCATSSSSTPDSDRQERSVPLVTREDPVPESQPAFDLLDLTLMHHYATSTWKHLFTGERQSQVWQHHVPALAASNEQLMHMILALTALHCAREDPGRRDMYRLQALHHHEIGLPLFKRSLVSAAPETAEVIVTCVILLGIWVFASPDSANERLSLDEILSTVETVRATRSVFKLYRDFVITTPIGLFLIPPCRDPLPSSEVYATQQAFYSLQGVVEHPSERRALCHLQASFNQYLTGSDQIRLAAEWMAAVDEEYWARLRDHQPYSILIFAYSCLLAYAAEHECWWMAGWSERILVACSENLSSVDKGRIQWDQHEELIQARGAELVKLSMGRHNG